MNPDWAEEPIVALVLLQSIVASDPALAEGEVLFTVTITVSATLEQPVEGSVTTKLYAVVVFGDALGWATVVDERPVLGDHA